MFMAGKCMRIHQMLLSQEGKVHALTPLQAVGRRHTGRSRRRHPRGTRSSGSVTAATGRQAATVAGLLRPEASPGACSAVRAHQLLGTRSSGSATAVTSRQADTVAGLLRPQASPGALVSCLACLCCRCRLAQVLPACEAVRALAAGVSARRHGELGRQSPVGAPLNELDSHPPPLLGCAQLHEPGGPVGQVADLGVLWVPPAGHIKHVHPEDWKIWSTCCTGGLKTLYAASRLCPVPQLRRGTCDWLGCLQRHASKQG